MSFVNRDKGFFKEQEKYIMEAEGNKSGAERPTLM